MTAAPFAWDDIADAGDPFPDLSDTEVMDMAADLLGLPVIHADTPLGRVVLAAYTNGVDHARLMSLKVFGTDLTKES